MVFCTFVSGLESMLQICIIKLKVRHHVQQNKASICLNIMKCTVVVLSALLFMGLSSCDEKHENETDNTVPIFTIAAPLSGSQYNNGDTVWIKGLLTDNELHEMSIDIIRQKDSSSLYHEIISVHDLSSYTIKSYWKSNVTDTTQAVVVLKAEDHKPNYAEMRIPIQLNK